MEHLKASMLGGRVMTDVDQHSLLLWSLMFFTLENCEPDILDSELSEALTQVAVTTATAALDLFSSSQTGQDEEVETQQEVVVSMLVNQLGHSQVWLILARVLEVVGQEEGGEETLQADNRYPAASPVFPQCGALQPSPPPGSQHALLSSLPLLSPAL